MAPPSAAGRSKSAIKRATSSTKPKATSAAATPASDWRAGTLEQLRHLILAADPSIVEERKWMKPSNPAGVPTWSSDGIVCTGETYKAVVKCTFANGASLDDPTGLFNESLDGNQRRAIDLREGESIDTAAFSALVRAAVALNQQKAASKNKKPARSGKA